MPHLQIKSESERKATKGSKVRPSRILIVEDELKLLDHLSRSLSDQDFSVFTCSNLRDLETLLSLPAKRFDLILLDRLLHGRDSAEIITRLKNEQPETKILILSAINTSAEKAAVLDLGADDYVAKPFDSEELTARIRALLRRDHQGEIILGNVVLDPDKRAMTVGGAAVPLQNKEFAFLRTLMSTPGKIFSKTFLYEQVWEVSGDVESNVVETTVNKIRRRLEETGATVKIKNMRHEGYWVEE